MHSSASNNHKKPKQGITAMLRRFGLTGGHVTAFMVLTWIAAFFEGFSLAMFLPVLEFIEEGKDVAALAGRSRLWQIIVDVFAAVGLEVSVLTLLSVVLIMLMARILFTYQRQRYAFWLTQGVIHRTRTNLFSAILSSDYGFFDTISTGQVVNVMTTETDRTGGYFNNLFLLVGNAVVLLSYLVVLLWLSAMMTFFAFALLLTGAGIAAFFLRHTKSISFDTTASNRNLAFELVERLGAHRLITLAAVTDREIESMREKSSRVRSNMFKLKLLKAQVDVFLEPVVVVIGIVIIWLAVSIFQMSLAHVGLFMLVLIRMLPMSKELLRARQMMHSNSGSLSAVNEMLDKARTSREELNSEHGKAFSGLSEGIRLEQVRFTYPNADTPALDSVDLFIPAKKQTALVGPSGSGKSTLVDLLAMLRRPQSGKILFDHEQAGDLDLSSLRRAMAFVSQDAIILNDTVRANILFASPSREVQDETIWKALEKAKAADFVHSLPHGLDTVLGERGIMLSGGQRQRLSLSRALLGAPSIIILDEPTSALDSETEKDIQAAIESLKQSGEVTLIIIAHRLSTVRDSDKIVVLSQGKVEYEGSHEELAASDTWYRGVLDIQHEGRMPLEKK